MDQPLNQRAAADDALIEIDAPRAFARLRAWTTAHVAELLCAALLAAMTLQMFAVISRKSITVDEVVMIPSAYYHLATGNFQLVNEHPPLAKFAAGIPLLKGRDLTGDDRAESMPVAVINQTMARRYWPGSDAAGRRVRLREEQGHVEHRRRHRRFADHV